MEPREFQIASLRTYYAVPVMRRITGLQKSFVRIEADSFEQALREAHAEEPLELDFDKVFDPAIETIVESEESDTTWLVDNTAADARLAQERS